MRRRPGGCVFAEDPRRTAPEARIIWDVELDPGTLRATALPASSRDPDAIDLERLRPWLTVVTDPAGEHVVLSDGWHRVRIDIEHGSLTAGSPVVLRYLIHGVASAEPKLLPLRRLIDLLRHGRFARRLFPRDSRAARHVLTLRVHDALRAGASQRDIALELFGAADASRADSIRSRVRRLVREARRMAAGGYRSLMQRGP